MVESIFVQQNPKLYQFNIIRHHTILHIQYVAITRIDILFKIVFFFLFAYILVLSYLYSTFPFS